MRWHLLSDICPLSFILVFPRMEGWGIILRDWSNMEWYSYSVVESVPWKDRLLLFEWVGNINFRNATIATQSVCMLKSGRGRTIDPITSKECTAIFFQSLWAFPPAYFFPSLKPTPIVITIRPHQLFFKRYLIPKNNTFTINADVNSHCDVFL